MTKEELHQLGYFTKLHGYKGELTAHLLTDDQRDYETLKHLFVDQKGQLVPYAVKLLEFKTNTSVKVKLEGIDSEEAAKQLVKCSIYINPSDLSELDQDKLALYQIIGYRVIDSEHGDIGVADSFQELSNNPLLVVQHGDVQILLPLNADFIDEIDSEQKEVHITAPEGLIDFYLSQ